MRNLAFAGVIALALLQPALVQPAMAESEYRAAVLRVDQTGRAPISRLDLPPDDLGFAGARLATADNGTTGQFMGQSFVTDEFTATPDNAAEVLEGILADDIRLIVTLADETVTGALADTAGDRALIVNARSRADGLRNEGCRPNLLHTAPSNAMLADALAQFLVTKRWSDWFLIAGSHPEDQALAEAYRHAARKFGARIVEERVYEDTGGARRTDSGHVQVQAQMPVFTQRARDHHVIVAADEAGIFAAWLPYHTWDARPVAGSAGLRPASWHPAHEAWGATQFQTRFERLANRPARDEDYQVWLALRALGEAASRTGSEDFTEIEAYIRSPALELAGFKGQALSFRDWDGQLRQPVLLATGPVVTSVSPQPQFLHQVSQLDSLGHDRPESQCRGGQQ
ncbi:ABC transporter substrate-binding protein [Halodurantibacterium flavum]|uniref:ABC transporter substrate-binding protein n=1 Tax=Halodurantibacterium flavum TaxID=1382802 RepID=A0ABW4SAJ6_9RHOB